MSDDRAVFLVGNRVVVLIGEFRQTRGLVEMHSGDGFAFVVDECRTAVFRRICSLAAVNTDRVEIAFVVISVCELLAVGIGCIQNMIALVDGIRRSGGGIDSSIVSAKNRRVLVARVAGISVHTVFGADRSRPSLRLTIFERRLTGRLVDLGPGLAVGRLPVPVGVGNF